MIQTVEAIVDAAGGAAKAKALVHGAGMDEISPLAPTKVIEIRNGKVSEWTVEPARFGYKNLQAADLAGGTPEANAGVVLAALGGETTKAARGAVVLNAAAALYVGGLAKTYEQGVEKAEEALGKRVGLAALERLRVAYAHNESPDAS